MPLPPALAARLAKRGLIKDDPKVQEEVFVEHYDDQTDDNMKEKPEDHNEDHKEEKEETEDDNDEEDLLIHECINCPNKTNPYHECVDYCKDNWGVKKFEHEQSLDTKRKKMLKKYPLSDTWLEVADPETGRFYYWNTETDEVSWLPPSHPRAKVSLPEEKLKEMARITAEESGSESSSGSDSSDESDAEEEIEEEMDIDDFEEIEKRVLKEKIEKERRQQEKSKRQKLEPLDPMDPASYSDIPRGTWSTGLETKGSAKTGVDATASGPLFQQRPYPSPGAILRMNKGD